MSEQLQRDDAFWRLIEVLESSHVLEHVMIIGTWAEWLYADYFKDISGLDDYRVDIGKTHDIDVYFRNYLIDIDGADSLVEEMRAAGFIPGSDYKGTFFFGGIEIEFLAGTAGAGSGVIEIPSVGIKAERLDELSLLDPAWVDKRGFRICIPTPASYAIQKLYINRERYPVTKRAQDMRKVDLLLRTMATMPGQADAMRSALERLPLEKEARVRETASAYGIRLPGVL